MSVYTLFVFLLNFFFLDRDPKKCAHYHGDKHLNKMQLEYAQIVSTVLWKIHGKTPFLTEEDKPHLYKPSHVNHPVVVWATQSSAHVFMIIEVGLALAEEKKSRAIIAKGLKKTWKTTHKSTPVLEWVKTHMPQDELFELGKEWVDPPACMPQCLKTKGKDVVDRYRLYYAAHKVQLTGLCWRPYVEEPHFLEECRQRLLDMNDVLEDLKNEEKKSLEKKEKKKKKE